ncbi:hypothetical protein [Bacillus thuringiensis]|uniref:hypothetical protein n=1 Tax=Bacillus thuringiensis TaxID=1428 RepID=UPI0026E30358|nr:hypothetical protein [Bacillus thuringiensis]MDO6633374.1 hypothetical protein [Bacillus thuringiensis]MDO6663536.1 hypothetical protein [Bacillus thuringiensis]MDO6703561.1 hypothetical protein [Bacillus thuringiensis]MED2800721.1 hypothetical protein [Bacillus thuringiensis]
MGKETLHLNVRNPRNVGATPRREDIESAADFSLPLVVDKEKLLSNIETVICGEDQ